MRSTLKFTINDVEYTWDGHTSSWFSSKEKGIKEGDLRYIHEEIFYVYYISRGSFFNKDIVFWVPINDADSCEKISNWKYKVI